MTDPLVPLLDGLVLVHPAAALGRSSSPVSASEPGVSRPTVVPLGGAVPSQDRWPTVLLAVPDVLALREAAGLADEAGVAGAPVLPALGRARRVAVWLGTGRVVPRLLPRPGWPAVAGIRARRLADGAWLAVVRFTGAAPATDVLAEIARQAVWRDDVGNAGLWVAGRASADAGGVRVTPDLDFRFAGEAVEIDAVLRRAPVTLDPREEPVGPLDERVLNPIGFRSATGPVVPLLPPAESAQLIAQAVTAWPRLGDALVESLRGAAAVEVRWPQAPYPDLARTVAGLSMAGIPLTSPPPPDWAAEALGGEVSAALTAPVDPHVALAREEHSLVLRRAAFDAHSTAAWRRRTGAQIGVDVAAHPSVSVLLATRRPDMLDFALRQVARQRGVEVELVLAAHGFAPDPAEVAAAVAPHTAVVRTHDASTLFGAVLADAAEVASGDVLLKMDDDDWYAPDVVTDLLRARAYSGAEVVGMPAEVHYLAEPDLTVRRGHTTEVYARFVAGGTLMIDRPLLHAVGSFRPVRKYVDAQLLHAVLAAGGSVYRTHGLGYVLRRNPSGHTWQVDLDYLLDPTRTTSRTPGFTPGRLLEADPHPDSSAT